MKSSMPKQPPFYIVGLPESPTEATMARMKFERMSSELTKVLPSIEEIRAVIKTKEMKDHSRYEVTLDIYTPRERHAFTESGYNLLTIFDAMGPKLKRLLSSRPSRVTATGGASRRKLVEE